MDGSLPGASAHGVLQARILEWVVTSYSRESSRPRDQTHVSDVSCIGFFTASTTWEAWYFIWKTLKSPLQTIRTDM